MCDVIYQITKDVHRTTSVFNQSHRKSFSEEQIESGWNPIYNILASYAEFDRETGYT